MNRGDALDLQHVVEEGLAAASAYRGKGKLADYIPALAEVDPNKMGIAIATGDGRVFAAGDAHEPFSIQSISKVFTLILALGRVGVDLWDHVGREPSGSAFNSIVQLESEKGKPRNPLINAGAIVTCDQLIGRRPPDEAVAEILAFLRERSGDPGVRIDERVASSEADAGNLNRSLSWFIRSFDNLANPVEEVLSVYFRQCGIAMSCAQLARAGLILAFDGKDPSTGEEIVPWHRARRINSVMMLCGHYDNSGEFAYRVGLPGKSGVGGGILTIVPGIGAIAVWSPGLNEYGTSLAGAKMLEKVVDSTGWTAFA